MIAPFAASIVRMLNEAGAHQAPMQASSMLSPAYAYLLTLNPILLIVLGVIVFFAGKLAKLVGAIMVIVGAALLILPFLLGIVHI